MQEEPLTDADLERYEEEPLQAVLARSQVFSIRLTADELRIVANEARLVRMTVGTFIKKAALDAAAMRRFSQPCDVSFGFQSPGIGVQGIQVTPYTAAGASPEMLRFDGEAYHLSSSAGSTPAPSE